MSPSDPNCQKSFYIIKDAPFSSFMSCDWHYIRWLRWTCLNPELWLRGFFSWTDGWTDVVQFFFQAVMKSCCSDAVCGFRSIMLISGSLITWSIDPPCVINTFIAFRNRNIRMNDTSIHWINKYSVVVVVTLNHETSDSWRSWCDWRTTVRWSLLHAGTFYMLKRRPDSCWRIVCVQIYSVNICIYGYILYMRRCVLPWWWS